MVMASPEEAILRVTNWDSTAIRTQERLEATLGNLFGLIDRSEVFNGH